MFFGCLLFVFTLIAAKKAGNFYLAPFVLFVAAVLITAYGFVFVRGFEGMAYGLLGAGMFLVSVIGIPIIPLLEKKTTQKQWNKWERALLVLLPIIFFATIAWLIVTDEKYWVIEEGTIPIESAEVRDGYYRVETISEGKKMVVLYLGQTYQGKDLNVDHVKVRGNTEVVIDVAGGDSNEGAPFIKIGLDEINEPLEVKTTEGTVFPSILEK
ncbi:hypothetical protein [Halobacillus litoralis]|uniref:hypothetical protein n=1 Tax=Halobacillus litoralis TaxID=45668 RepID=UPI001CFCDBA4|nr:hypothetical protein [Halobacillus litoralis]